MTTTTQAAPAKPEPFKFPGHVTNKKEALEVADYVFAPEPARKDWWVAPKTTPGEQYDRLRGMEDRFRNMLEWLYDDDGRMRIYASPRFHFFYRLTQNLFWNIRNAHELIDYCFDKERSDKKHAAFVASNIMTGDGQGI